jgi:hypothetical protein
MEVMKKQPVFPAASISFSYEIHSRSEGSAP